MKFLRETLYSKIVRMCLLIMFALLFIVGVAYTGVNLTIYNEMPLLSPNNPMQIFLQILFAWLFFWLMSKLYDKALYKVHPVVFTGITCAIVYGISVFWILSAYALPQADSKQIVETAMDITRGTQTPFVEDSYMSCFPYQLGMVTFIRVLVKIFGYEKYAQYSIVMALDVVLLIASGSGIIKHILPAEKSAKARFYYCLVMLFCLPLYIYGPFIYGDIPYAAFSLFAIYMLFECLEKPKWYKYILLFVACGANYLFRSYALITLIGMSVFLLIRAFDKKKIKSSLIAFGVMLSGTILFTEVNYSLYKDYNARKYDSIPMVCSVTMGFNDDNMNAGWCNFYEQVTFYESGFDAKAASGKAKADMVARFKEFAGEPGKAVDFFYRKINLQWNTPLFQSLNMICSHDEELQPSFARKIYSEFDIWWKLMKYSKLHQIFLYGVIFVQLLVWTVKKKEQTLKMYVPMIVVFGNFLFSIIWEAKTRYVFPSYLMLIPFGAVCIYCLQEYASESVNLKMRDYLKDSELKKQGYPGLDIIKFVMAFAVIAIHVVPHVVFVEETSLPFRIVDSLIQPAVGFFFLAAGFLLGKKLLTLDTYDEKKKAIMGYILKLLKMYLFWNVIYLPLAITEYVDHHYTVWHSIKSYFQGLFFVGEHYNSWILWYLLSSIYGCLFMLLLLKINVKERAWLAVALFIFMLSHLIDYALDGYLSGPLYDGICFITKHTIMTGRMLEGLAFLPLGVYLSKKKPRVWLAVVLTVGGFILAVQGRFGAVPAMCQSVGLFIFGVRIKLPNSKAWPVMREASMLMYLLHMLVYTAIYVVWCGHKIYGPTIFLLTCVATVAISFGYIFVKGKIKAAKKTEQMF